MTLPPANPVKHRPAGGRERGQRNGQGRRGVSLAEILVVAALLAGGLAGLLFWQRSTGAASQITAREQELANRLARMSVALRTDLRAARSLARPASDTWVVTVWHAREQGLPGQEDVSWRVSGEGGAVITRAAPGRTTVYDFTGLTGGKRFVFDIHP